jgi:hypothetical protein
MDVFDDDEYVNTYKEREREFCGSGRASGSPRDDALAADAPLPRDSTAPARVDEAFSECGKLVMPHAVYRGCQSASKVDRFPACNSDPGKLMRSSYPRGAWRMPRTRARWVTAVQLFCLR